MRAVESHEVEVSGYPGYYTHDRWREGATENDQRTLWFAVPGTMYTLTLTAEGNQINPGAREFLARTWGNAIAAWNVSGEPL